MIVSSNLMFNSYLLIILKSLLTWNICSCLETYTLEFNNSMKIVNTLPDEFVSFGLDTSLLRNMSFLPIDQSKFILLLKHLSPAYLRVGGTASDCLYFNKVLENGFIQSDQSYVYSQDISNFSISSHDLIAIHEFSKKTHLRMIFDLNVLIRKSDFTWDSSDALKIISTLKERKAQNVDWQLGNEPNSFPHVFNIKISASQLAKDHCKLRAILNYNNFKNSALIGPEVNHIEHSRSKGQIYLKEFLKTASDCVDYVSWHQYYLNGRTATREDFLNSTVFNILPDQIDIIKNVMRSNERNIPVWLSETGSAFGGGAPKLSNTFVAGFLWLDKLGISARNGINVVIRQSVFGGDYAMIESDLTQNPDWWLAVLFKKFVANKVFSIDSTDNLRLYAHCTPKKVSSGKSSGVTLYGMNLNNKPIQIRLRNLSQKTNAHIYVLTSDDLQSRNTFLNGRVLRLQENGDLPAFLPIIQDLRKPIRIPKTSMFFIVINNAKLTQCFSK
ncbi:heparanase-like [Trichogramma pretiosum]|uniref:heparanase-like n=1 Tax=Trichogramma pretiosum TaxID=7493 RepID=UPI0006C98655|nr:heparanase-like [Trichogramma pretiosum]